MCCGLSSKMSSLACSADFGVSLRLSFITCLIIASSSSFMLPVPASGLSKSKAHPCTASLLLLALLKKLELIADLSKPPGLFLVLAFVLSFSYFNFSLCSCYCLSCSALLCSASFPFTYGAMLVSSNSPSSLATLASKRAYVSFFLAFSMFSIASFCEACMH